MVSTPISLTTMASLSCSRRVLGRDWWTSCEKQDTQLAIINAASKDVAAKNRLERLDESLRELEKCSDKLEKGIVGVGES